MAKIRLDVLKRNESRPDSTIYTDLHMDLKFGVLQKTELHKRPNKDFQTDNNIGAIRNAFVSLLTTSQGEKILNPTFGINFGDLLFLPVTQPRARVIGETIVSTVAKFEPRVRILNVNVVANEDDQQYVITVKYTIPRFNNEPLITSGVLDQTGFYTT
jgi:phage baseplate assembly protein W